MGSPREQSLYDELGVAPSANQEQLRRAYRQRARELHPDVNDSLDDDSAMQRLNAAWAILGDPDARRRYDEQARGAAAPPVPEQPAATRPPTAEEPEMLSSASGCFGLLRPSVVIPVVLFVIFVVTAYSSHPGATTTPSPSTTSPARGGQTGTTAAPSTTVNVPAAALVGSCIQDQPAGVLLVPCSERPNSLVIATMPSSGRCPAGTSGYLVAGQSEMVCAQPNSP